LEAQPPEASGDARLDIDGTLILIDNPGSGTKFLDRLRVEIGEIVVTPGQSKLVESAKVKIIMATAAIP